MRVHLDFETRSGVSIGDKGAWEYAAHPTTMILCVSWAVDDGEPELWLPNMPPPAALLSLIASGATFAAHNAFFEQSVWHNICVKRYGWPPIPINQWCCTLAKASAHALPRGLAACGDALSLAVVKDESGGRVMKKITQYKKPTKKDPFIAPGTQAEHETTYEYCRQDVRAERAIDHALRDLSSQEQRIWQLDQLINMRGVHIDRPAVAAAIKHLAFVKAQYDGRMSALTNGEVPNCTGVPKLKKWLNAQMHDTTDFVLAVNSGREYQPIESTDKAAIVRLLANPKVPEHAKAVLRLRQEAGKSSTAKFQAMLDVSSSVDSRARDSLLYHAASTGRWGGKNIQMQNLLKGVKIEDMEAAVREMVMTPPALYYAKYGAETMLRLGSLIRGMITAAPGKTLDVADYSAIEAGAVLWLAGEEACANFHNGLGIYREMASDIYRVPVEQVTGDQRQLGKTVILGGGFGMGFLKFFLTCRSWGVTLPGEDVRTIVGDALEDVVGSVKWYFESDPSRLNALWEVEINPDDVWSELYIAKHVINTYRKRFPKVVDFWAQQEQAAIQAVTQPGVPVAAGKIHYLFADEFLWARLPSGRCLAYYNPMIEEQMKFGKRTRVLTFMGVATGKKVAQWRRQSTYGGSLCENVTQAVARDLMAEAMLRVEAGGYPVILTIHDEIISEVPEGFGSNEEFCSLLSVCPDWAHGMPIKVEGWRGTRYHK